MTSGNRRARSRRSSPSLPRFVCVSDNRPIPHASRMTPAEGPGAARQSRKATGERPARVGNPHLVRMSPETRIGLCKPEVTGSIPARSTTLRSGAGGAAARFTGETRFPPVSPFVVFTRFPRRAFGHASRPKWATPAVSVAAARAWSGVPPRTVTRKATGFATAPRATASPFSRRSRERATTCGWDAPAASPSTRSPRPERIADANGRRRYSLFTRDVGTALFAAACLDLDTRFPIFEIL